MGDTHFLLRHVLTGGVFILFAALGWWSGWPGDAMRYFQATDLSDLSDLVTLVVSSAVIGITIQGMHMLALDIFDLKFSDRARHIVSDAVRDIFLADFERRAAEARDPEVDGGEDELAVIERDRTLFASVGADQIFVWLYHRLAPKDLIEWARRRRSYSYLGINWAIAAVLGYLAGLAAPLVVRMPHPLVVALILAGGFTWCAGAAVAAVRLRREADRMEFVWAAARVRPDLRRDLTDLLSPQDETRLGGAIRVQLENAADGVPAVSS